MTGQVPPNKPKHVILGAGAAGRATAGYLQKQDNHVILASRSGSGPALQGVERVAVDAANPQQLSRVMAGATATYNCINPSSYTRWLKEWPPIHASLLQAAQATGAVLVTLSNLYMYGPMAASTTITPETAENPQDAKGRIRATMDREALQAHEAGHLRTVIVRASDFIGPAVGENGHATRNVPAIAQGRRAYVLGSAHQPHSWTDIYDVAETLATVAARPETHGRIWFAPTNPPVTQQELAMQTATALDAPAPKVSVLPLRFMKLAGVASPMLRELASIGYQFTGPWQIDSSDTSNALGLHPTDWGVIVERSAGGNERKL